MAVISSTDSVGHLGIAVQRLSHPNESVLSCTRNRQFENEEHKSVEKSCSLALRI